MTQRILAYKVHKIQESGDFLSDLVICDQKQKLTNSSSQVGETAFRGLTVALRRIHDNFIAPPSQENADLNSPYIEDFPASHV